MRGTTNDSPVIVNRMIKLARICQKYGLRSTRMRMRYFMVLRWYGVPGTSEHKAACKTKIYQN
jgi:hypothetical protein